MAAFKMNKKNLDFLLAKEWSATFFFCLQDKGMGGPNAKRFDRFNRHSHWHAGPNRGKTACHAYTPSKISNVNWNMSEFSLFVDKGVQRSWLMFLIRAKI